MAFDQDRVAHLFERLDRQLTKLSSNPQPKAVHLFRTAARRMETVLTALVPEPDRKQLKVLKLLTKLRRRAGKVRDLDVQLAALRSLKVSDQPGVKTQLLQAMSEKRAKREKRFLATLDKETVRELRRRLTRVHDHFPKTATEPRAVVRDMLAEFSSNNSAINEKVLHQYRIQGKKIRYIAELAASVPDLRHTVDELKRMQDALGEWHDWLTLEVTVSRLLPDTLNSPLLAAIRNVMRAKYRDAVQAVVTAKGNLVGAPASASKIAASSPKFATVASAA